jgi:hypothetical protein
MDSYCDSFTHMRIQEIPNRVIPWEGSQSIMVIIHVSWGLVGFGAAMTVLLAHITQKVSANLLLTLSLCVADLYFISSVLIFGFINISQGGWATGQVGCAIDAFIVLSSCFCSIWTLMTATLERYFQVVRSKDLTKSRAWLSVIGLWLISFVIGGLPLITNTYQSTYGLQSTNLLCNFSWWNNSPAQYVMHFFSFGAIFGCLAVIIFCYAGIFLKFRKTVRSVQAKELITQSFMTATAKTVGSESTKSEKESIFSPKEVRLLIKSVVLTCTYVIGWTPYLIKIIVEIATEKRVPSEWEFFCQMCVLTNSTMNSFLMIFLDARVKENVMTLFSRFGSK